MDRPNRDVLVVEDNEILRSAIADFFRHVGLDVETASDGQAALDHLEYASFAVLLLDYQMPVMNGLAVVEHLGQRPSRPIILMMTGFEDIDSLPINGRIVQAVLPKPFDLEVVAGIIQACVAELRGQTTAFAHHHST